jgi:hypothetical protein
MESSRESTGPGSADPSCTLDPDGRLTRAGEFSRFFADVVLHAERPDPATLILRLRPDHQAGQVAGGLAAAETACCSFFRFVLTATAGCLSLEVTVPPDRAAALDGLLGAGRPG